MTVAGFLGGRDSNFNMGLFRPDRTWTRAALLKLLRSAGGLCRNPVDLFVLRNQPLGWDGFANPFRLLPDQPSPSFGYKVALPSDPDAFVRQNLSKDNRKKLRGKRERLEALGPLRHEVARTPETGAAILDAFLEQRLARCVALGLSASDLPDLGAFLSRASVVEHPDPPVELHALLCGERTLATFAGATHLGRFCGMVMSFDADPDTARSSPGEILLAELIRSKCTEGLSTFDLGVGEARYKDIYCPEPEPLFDSLIAISGRGRFFATEEKLRLRLKREVKQSAWAWPLVRAVRKMLRAVLAS